MNTPFLFVGERPSPKAEQIGATWRNGKLAGKTLRAALLAVGISPDTQEYINLWKGTSAEKQADIDAQNAALDIIEKRKGQGYTIVAMGAKVSHVLVCADVEHLKMVHPAARGSIRKTERYQAHVGAILGGAACQA